MPARVKLSDSEFEEIINIEEIIDPNVLHYKDQDDALNTLCILSNGLKIIRKARDHITTVVLFNDEPSYILIDSEEGNLKIDVKVLEFKKINDIITLAYSIEDEIKTIEVRYIGV